MSFFNLQNRFERFDLTHDRIQDGQLSAIDGIKDLFIICYEIDKFGCPESAEPLYTRTINLLETHKNKSNGIPPYVFAQIAVTHGNQLFSLGRAEAALLAFKRAIETLEELVKCDAAMPVIEQMTVAIHRLACCQRQMGASDEALISYRKALRMMRLLLQFRTTPERDKRIHAILDCIAKGYCKVLKSQ